MKNVLSEVEKKILCAIQHGMPESLSPYEDMACEIGISVDELLKVLADWKENGKLRRLGAVVNHFKVGLPAGAMVVWKVEEERVVEVGGILSDFREVSHAYERVVTEQWSHNVYTMVHGGTEAEVKKTVKAMSDAAGIEDYRKLITVKELKKVPPTYIIED